MNRCVLALSLWAMAALAQAETPLWLAQNLPGANSSNPYNSPIRRVNPNSLQGTQPSAPPLRAPNTVPVPRSPSVPNGGVGNGYPRTPDNTAPAPRLQTPAHPAR